MKKSIQKLKQKRKIAKQHIAPKLLKRLKIFAVIITVIISIVIYKLFLGELGLPLAGIGLFIGTTIGLIAGRMFKIHWDTETEKVVSKLDKIGVIFLILYIAIEIGRKWLFGYWLHGSELNAFGLIFLAGLLLGRLLAMLKNIRKVLIQEEKI